MALVSHVGKWLVERAKGLARSGLVPKANSRVPSGATHWQGELEAAARLGLTCQRE